MTTTPTTSSIDPVVRVEHPLDGVALVTLNRPERLNAFDLALCADLTTTFAELGADDHVRVVIVTGAGRGFCSGADLLALGAGMQNPDQSGFASSADLMHHVVTPMLELIRIPQPTIAAVNGPAIGAGWGLAMGCDIRIASPAARFGATFGRMGLGPDYGLSQTLPLTVGGERALELLLTGRIIDADEAHRIGLVSTIAPDPVEAAIALAGTIATVPGRASRSTKSTLRRARNADLHVVVAEFEANAQAELFDHPDFLADAAKWFSRHSSG